MLILDALRPEFIKFPLQADSWQTAVIELVELLEAAQEIEEHEHFASRVIGREDLASTHILPEMAFPHAASETATRPCLAVGRFADPIPWPGVGVEPVSSVFLIALPASDHRVRIQIMQEICGNFQGESIREALTAARDATDIYNLLHGIDTDFGVPREFHLKKTLTGQQDFIHCLAWSRDGRWSASGGPSRDQCRVWVSESGRMETVLRGHGGPVYAIAWSPTDGISRRDVPTT